MDIKKAKEINMQDSLNQYQQQNHKIRWLAAAGAVIVVVAAAALLLLPAKKPGQPAPAKAYEKGSHNQSLSATRTFRLAGSQPGKGMSFMAPSQYVLAFKSDNNDQAALADAFGKGQQQSYLGAIFVQSSPVNGDTQSLAPAYRKAFADPKSAAYKSSVDSIEQFVSQRMSPLYDIKFSAIRGLNSSNLKNAWVMDITAAAKPVILQNAPPGAPSQVKNPNLEDQKGQAILAVGESTIYYFAVYNTTYNWDNNSTEFVKIITSLKVDQ